MKNKKPIMMIVLLTLVPAAFISIKLFTRSSVSGQAEDKMSEKISVESGTFYHDTTGESDENIQEKNDISSSGKLKIGYSIKDR